MTLGTMILQTSVKNSFFFFLFLQPQSHVVLFEVCFPCCGPDSGRRERMRPQRHRWGGGDGLAWACLCCCGGETTPHPACYHMQAGLQALWFRNLKLFFVCFSSIFFPLRSLTMTLRSSTNTEAISRFPHSEFLYKVALLIERNCHLKGCLIGRFLPLDRTTFNKLNGGWNQSRNEVLLWFAW